MRASPLLAAAALIAAAFFVAVRRPGKPSLPSPVAAPAAAPAPALRPGKPARPPGPDDPHPPPPPEPVMPTPSAEWRAAVAEKVRGTPLPGAAAHRALSDAYVDANIDFAREQAAREGLTMDQFRELTDFGLVVLATQRVSDLEELVGRSLGAEEREGLAALMRTANEDFKREMRALVARGGGEAERWELIRKTEAVYRRDLFALTGMTAELLDDLLAGNVLLPGAPASWRPPAGAPSPEPRDDVAAPEKPR